MCYLRNATNNVAEWAKSVRQLVSELITDKLMKFSQRPKLQLHHTNIRVEQSGADFYPAYLQTGSVWNIPALLTRVFHPDCKFALQSRSHSHTESILEEQSPLFSVFIDPCLLLDFAFSAHSDHCLSAGYVTGELQFMLPFIHSQGDARTRVRPQMILVSLTVIYIIKVTYLNIKLTNSVFLKNRIYNLSLFQKL